MIEEESKTVDDVVKKGRRLVKVGISCRPTTEELQNLQEEIKKNQEEATTGGDEFDLSLIPVFSIVPDEIKNKINGIALSIDGHYINLDVVDFKGQEEVEIFITGVLTLEELKKLTKALKIGSSLTTLIVKSIFLDFDVGLTPPKVDNDQVKYIVDIVESHLKIKYLCLNANVIGGEGVEKIVNALVPNSVIEEIDFHGNQIDCRGAEFLADLLKQKHSMRVLHLEDNWIRNKGIKYIAEALQINEGLRKLYLDQNPTQYPVHEELLKACIHNKNIEIEVIRPYPLKSDRDNLENIIKEEFHLAQNRNKEYRICKIAKAIGYCIPEDWEAFMKFCNTDIAPEFMEKLAEYAKGNGLLHKIFGILLPEEQKLFTGQPFGMVAEMLGWETTTAFFMGAVCVKNVDVEQMGGIDIPESP